MLWCSTAPACVRTAHRCPLPHAMFPADASACASNQHQPHAATELRQAAPFVSRQRKLNLFLLPCPHADEEADSSDEEKAEESEDEEEWMRKLIAGALCRFAGGCSTCMGGLLRLPLLARRAFMGWQRWRALPFPLDRLHAAHAPKAGCLSASPTPPLMHASASLRLTNAGKLSKGDKLVAVDHAQIQYPPFRCVALCAVCLLELWHANQPGCMPVRQ